MIALATALLDNAASPGGELGLVPTWRVASHFEQFLLDALCLAVRPSRRGRPRLLAIESPEFLARHGTCTLAQLRLELGHWVGCLEPGAGPTRVNLLEAALLGQLMRPSNSQCVYRLAPLHVPGSRPVVLLSADALGSYGRVRMLHALWESECAAGAGSDQEYGALYDESLERARASAAGRAEKRAMRQRP